jgi:galactonate dehydratase
MEIDMDDVPWREELFTVLPQIENGQMVVPSGAGWGTELDEKTLNKYAV